MKQLAILILLLLLAPLAASAQVEPEPDPWKDYPAREVDRTILPVKDGYLMGVSLRTMTARDELGSDGTRETLPKAISVFNLDLNVHYGITEKWDIFAGLPYATAQTSDFSAGAIGNIYIGTRLELYTNDRIQLAAGLQVSFPTGDAEYHYRVIDGDVVAENFRTGDPGMNYYPELEAWYKANDDISLRLRVQAIFTDPGETVLNQIGGIDQELSINPGDGFRVQLTALLQASDRWAIPIGLDYFRLSQTELSHFNFDDEHELLEVRGGVLFQVSPVFDASLMVGSPLFGRNTYLATPLWLELRTRF